MKKTFAILLLLLVSGALAQTSFVQSRFFGTPSSDSVRSQSCSTCLPSVDGILEYRLGEPRKENTTATFTVQMRVDGGDSEVTTRTRLTMASVRLAYNEVVFGERVVETGKCSASLAGEFSGKGYQEILGDTFDNAFTFTATTTTQIVATDQSGLLLPDALVKLTDQFEDFVTIECSFGSITSGDLGVAVSGTDISSNMIYIYDNLGSPTLARGTNRNIFPLVRNDLRSVRVENNSIYAEDYTLFLEGDGSGVFVTFSGDITPALVAADFVLDPQPSDSSIMISTVQHMAGQDRAGIRFNGIPPSGTILRFVDNTTRGYAANGHIAELIYDTNISEAPPIATTRTFVSRSGNRSTWSITFDKALDENSVKADSLCLTQTPGTCPEQSLLTSSIVTASRNTSKTITIVIQENINERGVPLTVAFKRNSVRGANSNPVNEYQPALVGQFQSQDNNLPSITIVPSPSEEITLLDDGTPSEQQISVTVTDANAADNITISLAVDEDAEIVRIAGTNPVTIVGVSGGNAERTGQIFTLQSREGQSGNTTVTVTVTDGSSSTPTTQEIRVTVEENVAPDIIGLTGQTITVNETETVEFMVTDPNTGLGDITTVTAISVDLNTLGVGNVIEGPGNGNYSVNITSLAVGMTMLTVTATDSANNTATQTVNVNVMAMNTAPTLYDSTPRDISIRAGSTGTTSIFVTDAEGGSIDATAAELGEESSRLLTINPSDSQSESLDPDGQRQFQWDITARTNVSSIMTRVVEMTATDVGGLSVTSITRVTILPNAAPTIMGLDPAQRINLDEGTLLNFTVTDSDSDNENLSATVSVVRVNGTDILGASLTNTDADFRLTMTGLIAGQTTVTVTVEDEINVVSHEIRVTVNEAPQITQIVPNSLTLLDAGVGTTGSVQVFVSDDVAGNVTIEMESQNPSLLTIDPTTRTVTIAESGAAVPSNAFIIQALSVNENTTVTVTITTTDGDNVETTASIMVRIIPNADPVIDPIANIDNLSTGEQRLVNFTVDDTNGDITTVTIVEVEGSNLIATIGDVEEIEDMENGYSVRITAGTMAGNTTLTMTVTDSANNEDTQEVKVTIVRANAAPQITRIVPNPLTLLNSQPFSSRSIEVFVSDDAIGNVDITVRESSNGAVTISTDSTITSRRVTRPVNIESADMEKGTTFGVQASAFGVNNSEAILDIWAIDSKGERSATTSITVILEVNQSPSIEPITAQTVAVGSINIVRFRVTDPNIIEPINVSVAEIVSDGTERLDVGELMNDGNGNYSVQITGEAAGDAMLRVSARDSRTSGNDGLVTQEVRVTVTEPESNNPPQITEIGPLPGTNLLAGRMRRYTISVTDSDMEDLTVMLSANTNLLEISPTTQIVTHLFLTTYSQAFFTVNLENNIDSRMDVDLEITVTDGTTSSSVIRQLTIVPNSPPVITLSTTTQTLVVGEVKNLDFTATDIDSLETDTQGVGADNVSVEGFDENILTARRTGQRANFRLILTGKSAGQTTVTVVAEDDEIHRGELATRHEIVVTVTQAPEAVLEIVEVPSSFSLLDIAPNLNTTAVQVSVSDGMAGNVTIEMESQNPNLLTIDPTTRTVTIAESGTPVQSDNFTITAEDVDENTTVTVTITATNSANETTTTRIEVRIVPNEAPAITEIVESVLVNIDEPEIVRFTVRDPNAGLGDFITTVTAVEIVSDGTERLNVGNVEFSGNEYSVEIEGIASGGTMLMVTAADSAGTTDTRTVNVNVNAPPEFRSFISSQIDIVPGRIVAFDSGVTVSDVESGTLDITIEEQDTELLTITLLTPTVTIEATDGGLIIPEPISFRIEAKANVDSAIDTEIRFTLEDEDGGRSFRSIPVMIERNERPVILSPQDYQTTLTSVLTVELGMETGLQFVMRDLPKTSDQIDLTNVSVGPLDSNNIVTTATIAEHTVTDGTIDIERTRNTGLFLLSITAGEMAGQATVTVVAEDELHTVRHPIRVTVNANPTIELSTKKISLLDAGVTSNAEVNVTVTDADIENDITISLIEDNAAPIVKTTPTDITISSSGQEERTAQTFTIQARANETGDTTVTVRVFDGTVTIEDEIVVTVTENSTPTITLRSNMLMIGRNTTEMISFDVTDDEDINIEGIEVTEDDGVDILNDRIEVTAAPNHDDTYRAMISAEGMSGSTTLTVMVTDSAGNEATEKIQVSVVDSIANVAPQITEVSPGSLSLLDAGNNNMESVRVTVSDNTANDVTITMTEVSAVGRNLLTIMPETQTTMTLAINEGIQSDPFIIKAMNVVERTEVTVLITATDSGTRPLATTANLVVTIVPNAAPVIANLLAPDPIALDMPTTISFTVTDANVELGDTVTITADAADSTISVEQVEVVEGEDNVYTVTVDITGVTAGQTTLTVTATDSANTTTTASIQVTVNANPRIDLSTDSISLLNAGATSNTEVNVTVTDADITNNITISLAVDDAAQIVKTTPTMVTISGSDGTRAQRTTQTFTIQAIANRIGDTTVTVQVFDGTVTIEDEIVVSVSKNVAPVIELAAIPTIETNMATTVNFTVIDANIALEEVAVSTTVTDSTILTVGSVERVADTNSYLVAITAGATGGNTTLTVTATDSAGNSNTREVRVTVVERSVNVAPRITQVLPESLSLLDAGPRNTTEVTVFVEGDVSGMVNIKMEEVGTGNLMISPSSQTVTIQAGGEARQSDAFRIIVEEDIEVRTTVTVLITATDSGTSPLTTTANLVVTIVPNDPPVIANLLAPDPIALDMPTTISFIVTDENAELGDTVTVTAADADPSILRVGEVVEGEDNSYSVDITGMIAGQTTLTVTATDSANTTTTASIQVTVNANPQITELSPDMISLLDDGTPSTASVRVTVADADAAGQLMISFSSSLIDDIENVEISAGMPQSFTLSAKENTTGTATVTVTVSDGVAITAQSIILRVTENVSPVIGLAAIPTIETNMATTVNFTVTDANIALEEVAVSTTVTDSTILSIGTVMPGSEDNSYSVGIRGRMSGQTTLTVTARDSAGNSNTREVRVTVSETTVNVAPQITEVSPRSLSLLDAGNNNMGSVQVTVSDNTANNVTIMMEEVGDRGLLTIDPETQTVMTPAIDSREIQSDPFNIVVAANVEEETDVTVRITATDSGTSPLATTANLVVTIVPNDPPVIANLLAPDPIALDMPTTISFIVRDENAELGDTVTVTAADADPSILRVGEVVEGENNSYSVDITGMIAGQTTLTVTATDSANTTTTASIQVTVNANPRIELSTDSISLLDAGLTSNTQVNVTATDDDVTDEITISLEVDAAAPIVTISPTNAMIAGGTVARRPAQTFTIQAIDGMFGNTTVTVVVDDGTTTDEEIIVVTVDENITPTITLRSNMLTIGHNTTRTISFDVMDDEDINIGDIEVTEDAGVDILDVGAVNPDGNTYRVMIGARATSGITTLTVMVTDSVGNEASQKIRVTVSETTVNVAPKITEVSTRSLSLLDAGNNNMGSVQVTVSDDTANDVEITMEEVGDASNLMITGSPQTIRTLAIDEEEESDPFIIKAMNVVERTEVTVLITATDSGTPPLATTANLVVTIVPNVAPEIELEAIGPIALNTSTPISFTVTDENIVLGDTVNVTAAAASRILVVGEVEVVVGEDNIYTVDITGVTAGQTTLTVTAIDSANTTTTASIQVTVNANPRIDLSTDSISLLNAGATSNTQVNVTVTDANIADIIMISLTVDEDAPIVEIVRASTATIEAGTQTERAIQTFTIQAIEDGDTTVTVQVFDGTVRIEDEIAVSISNNVAPVIIGLTDQTIETNMATTVSFTVMDVNIALEEVAVSTTVTDSTILSIGTVMPGNEDNSYSVSIRGRMSGQTTLTVTARDSAGNSNTREVRVTVSETTVNVAPQITEVSPRSLSLLDAGNNNMGSVQVTVSDNTANNVTIMMEEVGDRGLLTIDPETQTVMTPAIDSREIQSDPFNIVVAANVEEETDVTVRITATDSGTSPLATTANLVVTIVPNDPPVIANLLAPDPIALDMPTTISFIVRDENAELGDTVTVTAADADPSILRVGEVVEGENNSYSVDITGMIAGQTTLTVTATDSANTTTTASIQVTVNANPQITELSPDMISLLDDGTPSTASVRVTVADADAAGQLMISFSSSLIDDIENVEISTGMPQSFTLSAKENTTGTATVTVTVSDGVAITAQSIILRVTENVSPVIGLAAIPTIETNMATTVNFTVTDANIALEEVAVSTTVTDSTILSIGTVMPGSEDNSYSVGIRGRMSGQTALTVTARDSANDDVTASIQVTVNANPRIELSTDSISLLDAGLTSNTQVNVTATDDDVTDEITISLEVDAAAPIVTISPTNAMIAGGTVARRPAQTFTIQAIDGMFGNTTVTVVVDDGTTTDEEIIVVTVDENITPTITLRSNMLTIGHNTTRTISFDVMDDEDINIGDIEVTEDAGVDILDVGAVNPDGNTYRVMIGARATSGITTLTVMVTDSVGNEASQKIRVTVSETTVNVAPKITEVSTRSLSLLDAGNNNMGSVQVTVSDDTANDVEITMEEVGDASNLMITGSPQTIRTLAIDEEEESDPFIIKAMNVVERTEVTVLITATDSGTPPLATTANLVVTIVPNVAPEIELEAIGPIALNTSTPISFTVTDENIVLGDTVNVTAAAASRILVVGEVEVVVGEDNIYTVDITGVTAGQTTLTVTAIDSANTTTTASIQVTVNANPRIDLSTDSISLLNAGATSNTQVNVTVTDANIADIIMISLTVDEDAPIVEIVRASTATIEAGTQTERAIQTFTIQAIEDGDTTVTVQVFDGTVRIEDEIAVSISNNVAPVIIGLTDQTIETNMATTVSFTVMDVNIALEEVAVSTTVTDSTILSIGTVMPGNEDNSYSVSIRGRMSGQTTLTVTARDSAGNSNTREVRVTVSETTVNVAPQITEVSPRSLSLLDAGNNNMGSVQVTVSDNTANNVTIMMEEVGDRGLLTIDPETQTVMTPAIDSREIQSDPFNIVVAANVEEETDVTVRITATDSGTSPLATTANLVVTIVPNDPPVIANLLAPDPIALDMPTTISFIVRDENAELGDTVTVTAADADPSILRVGEVVEGENNSYSVDITGMIAGQTTLTVTATDSANTTTTASIQVTVNANPQITELSPDMISLLDDGTPSTASVRVTVADADAADAITISLEVDTVAPIVTISPADAIMIEGGTEAMRVAQTFTLSARENMSGNTTVTVTVSDGTARDEASIVVTVTENIAPAITGLVNQTIEPNTTQTVSFTVMDTNAALGDIVTVTAAETGGALILNIGTVMPGSVDILGKVAGQTTLTVTATDSAGNEDTQEARVTIESTGIRIRARIFLEGPLR